MERNMEIHEMLAKLGFRTQIQLVGAGWIYIGMLLLLLTYPLCGLSQGWPSALDGPKAWHYPWYACKKVGPANRLVYEIGGP